MTKTTASAFCSGQPGHHGYEAGNEFAGLPGTDMLTQAAVVQDVERAASRPRDGVSQPTPPLHPTFEPMQLVVRPVPPTIARVMCEQHHYLRSYPGGSKLNFGVFADDLLLGVVVLGVGPTNLHRLFRDAESNEVLCLTRFWLDDRCSRNSESRILGIILRQLSHYQSTVKAVVAYSDPAAGHTGLIYRAAGLLNLGMSSSTPQYRLPDGSLHHPRSLGYAFGTHSIEHFASNGMKVELVDQPRKHIYVALVDKTWRNRLTRPVRAYTSKTVQGE